MDTSNDNTAPYPGLRYFTEDERLIFFGRESQTAQILTLLKEFNFVAVIGESGCGKSSLVRAGVIPSLRGGGLDGSGADWLVSVMRPGVHPIRNLATSISKVCMSRFEASDLSPDLLEESLRSTSMGLDESIDFALETEEPSTRALIVVDQFEELFRFGSRSKGGMEEAIAFVQLLLNAVNKPNSKTFVLITMRLDFLRECATIPGLSEELNRGQYLVPPMQRHERRMAIDLPAKRFGKTISPRLIERALNDAGEAADQLPVLQHALMRAWYQAGDEAVIDLEHYNEIGGASTAVSKHANAIYDALPSDRYRLIAERLFKAISFKSGRDAVRRPLKFSTILNIVGENDSDALILREVIDSFSGQGVDFIISRQKRKDRASSNEEVEIVEVSHEAILRVWDKLAGTEENAFSDGWIQEEAKNSEYWQELKNSFATYSVDKTNYLRGYALGFARDWWQQQKPNIAWAKLYEKATDLHRLRSDDAGFSEVQTLLDVSLRHRNNVRNWKWFLGAIGTLALLVLAYSGQQKYKKEKVDKYLVSAESNIRNEDFGDALTELDKLDQNFNQLSKDKRESLVDQYILLAKELKADPDGKTSTGEKKVENKVLAKNLLERAQGKISSSDSMRKDSIAELFNIGIVESQASKSGEKKAISLSVDKPFNFLIGNDPIFFSPSSLKGSYRITAAPQDLSAEELSSETTHIELSMLTIDGQELASSRSTGLTLSGGNKKSAILPFVTLQDDPRNIFLRVVNVGDARRLKLTISEYQINASEIKLPENGFVRRAKELVKNLFNNRKSEDEIRQYLDSHLLNVVNLLDQRERSEIVSLVIDAGRVEMAADMLSSNYITSQQAIGDDDLAAAISVLESAIGSEVDRLKPYIIEEGILFNQVAWRKFNSLLDSNDIDNQQATLGLKKLIDYSVEIDDEDAFRLDTRGQILFRMGEYKQAFEDINKSIEKDVNYAGTYYVRALLYENSGKSNLAREDYVRGNTSYAESANSSEDKFLNGLKSMVDAKFSP